MKKTVIILLVVCAALSARHVNAQAKPSVHISVKAKPVVFIAPKARPSIFMSDRSIKPIFTRVRANSGSNNSQNNLPNNDSDWHVPPPDPIWTNNGDGSGSFHF